MQVHPWPISILVPPPWLIIDGQWLPQCLIGGHIGLMSKLVGRPITSSSTLGRCHHLLVLVQKKAHPKTLHTNTPSAA